MRVLCCSLAWGVVGKESGELLCYGCHKVLGSWHWNPTSRYCTALHCYFLEYVVLLLLLLLLVVVLQTIAERTASRALDPHQQERGARERHGPGRHTCAYTATCRRWQCGGHGQWDGQQCRQQQSS